MWETGFLSLSGSWIMERKENGYRCLTAYSYRRQHAGSGRRCMTHRLKPKTIRRRLLLRAGLTFLMLPVSVLVQGVWGLFVSVNRYQLYGGDTIDPDVVKRHGYGQRPGKGDDSLLQVLWSEDYF